MIEYEDISLKIEPKQGEFYPVIVLKSPAGEGRSTLTLPFNPDDVGDILFDLSQTVRSSTELKMRDVSIAATSTKPRQIGDQLFNALFNGVARSLLDRSLGMIHGKQRGLRIKIHIDPEDPSLAQLASLPWEFMYQKETRNFLNLSRYTPILRYLDVQSPYTPLKLELPLRILVVISDPIDYTGLDLDKEREMIKSTWAKLDDVQVEFMEEATIMGLQDRLVEHSYHVLHYMGHGGFDERRGRGVLILKGEDGRGTIVDGRMLGILLQDLPTMRLVFLNACETAKVTKDKGLDPFAGVASAMVLAGIPAVVAMQFPVSDGAAINFSQKFYPLLARGYPIDAAVAEGRRAIRLAENETMEWGTPVLFLRAPYGIIFQIPDKPPELSDVAEVLEESKFQLQLAQLSDNALNAEEHNDWKTAITFLEELIALGDNTHDAAERLEQAQKNQKLMDLYVEAQRLSEAEQWQLVMEVFDEINLLHPDYPDPEGILFKARSEIAKEPQDYKLDDLYHSALKELAYNHFIEAESLLRELNEIEPGYRDADLLLAKTQNKISHQVEERRKQEEINSLYEQALTSAKNQKWEDVLNKVSEIQALDPRFIDTEGITNQARAGISKETEKAQKQRRVAGLYDDSVRLLNAKQYQEALNKLGEVRVIDPKFPDSKMVEPSARKQLDKIAKKKTGRSFWRTCIIIFAVILISSIVVISCIAVIVFLLDAGLF